MMKNIFNYDFKICTLFIAEENEAVCNVFFSADHADFVHAETPLIKKAAKQIEEYFNGKRKVFDLPYVLHGTDFQVKVWEALVKIPYGETRSYAEIAAITGNPKACRAVGMANNRNPIPIIIPCHRVIGSNGSLTGFAGGLDLKQKLLDLEKVF